MTVRFYFASLLFFLLGISLTYGQKPTPSPTEKPRPFGWSLEKYNEKKTKDAGKKAPQSSPVPAPTSDGDEIKVETDLVINDVLVSNPKGSIIQGLTKEDFVVTEDGFPQKIEVFSFGNRTTIPRSIVLVLDHLGLQQPYITRSILAARTLVDSIGPKDEMAIVTSDEKLRQAFTNDKQALNTALNVIANEKPVVWGGREFSALLATLNEMFDGESQRIIVFQGDGGHAIWLNQDQETPFRVSASTLYKSGGKYQTTPYRPGYGFSDIKDAIELSRATIYSAITGMRYFGLSKDEQLDNAKQAIIDFDKHHGSNGTLPILFREFQYVRVETGLAGQTAMFKIAELSGGTADFIEKPEDAQNVYSNIFTIMSNRYSLGYYPTNQNRDGKRREVKIEVKGRPDLIITTRRAYTLR